MPPATPRPPLQPDLFDRTGNGPAPAPKLLKLGQVADLFMVRLNISETTYYQSFRDWVPVIHTRIVPIRGQKGRYRNGSPRVRDDIARELVELAASGRWREYCEGTLTSERPHLYAPNAGKRSSDPR